MDWLLYYFLSILTKIDMNWIGGRTLDQYSTATPRKQPRETYDVNTYFSTLVNLLQD